MCECQHLQYRRLLALEPRLVEYLPFGPDEQNKLVYADYNGMFVVDVPAAALFPPPPPSLPPGTSPAQNTPAPPDTERGDRDTGRSTSRATTRQGTADAGAGAAREQVYVLFRERFQFAEDDALLVPKLFAACASPRGGPRFRLINNDTLEETPLVFSRLEPRRYRRNQKGYTLMAEIKYTWEQLLAAAQAAMPVGAGQTLSLKLPIPGLTGTTVSLNQIHQLVAAANGQPVPVPVPLGNWRARLISTVMPLPLPLRSTPSAAAEQKPKEGAPPPPAPLSPDALPNLFK